MSISNSDDMIDSREVISRISELADERQALVDEIEEAEANVRRHHKDVLDPDGEYPEHEEYRRCRDALTDWDASEEAEELTALKALAGEAEWYSVDWRHGVTLIRESYFTTYARDLAVDIGAVSDDAKWPCTCIDWDEAADELKMDYTSVDFDGVTYYVR
jgi:hypothetical protein